MHLENAKITGVSRAGPDYRVLTLAAPAIAAAARPGQFVHLRIPRGELVLRRPFSIYRAEKGRITILYKMVGAGTMHLDGIECGSRLSLMGPLGNEFPPPVGNAVPLLVAGGYGVAPLSFFARSLARPGELFVGGRSRRDILCLADFRKLGWKVRVTTEDGSMGTKGLVTAALDKRLAAFAAMPDSKSVLYACGPDGMLRAVCERAVIADVPAWISMDRHMGCGVGACLACVQRIREENGAERWGRVCKEGPIFDSRSIVWK